MSFFESLGFRCPERKGVADFLQEVTSLRDQEVRHTRRATAEQQESVPWETAFLHRRRCYVRLLRGR
jgi:hypothetical protein